MLHRQANQPRSLFRGNEMMRLMTMFVMLGVIFLLIVRSRDPNMWTWLTSDAGTASARNPAAAADRKSDRNEKNHDQKNEDKRNDAAALEASQPSRPAESNEPRTDRSAKEAAPSPNGATDLDVEESGAIAEEFQAVADGQLSIQPEEMPAYNRLLDWVSNQTIGEMRRRARKNPVYTQFYQSPEKYRGQLFEFDLNVRRILEYTHKDRTLYEVWGWTEESRSWPYVGVVLDLPKGMPTGADVFENTTLVGYFFKMQGYVEAGAKPRAAPLQAPLFVGRLIWRPAGKAQARPADWSWVLLLLAAFVIFLIVRWGLLVRGGRRRLFQTPKMLAQPGGDTVEGWLAKVESEEADETGEAADDDGHDAAEQR